ncbi:hypothetical protein MTR67_028225 [Solanum verrucosum]|uniref:Uncharacterized protein n=1 Tax=Solanum verrucosum TaxID=315347 RepID=A0AAF0TZW2_SOLVR|nr:hypothetical protein MTR67_028225 [Solanum verrucosum]
MARVKEGMEKAFLDGVIQSLKQDNPIFRWVLKLMKEAQNELCETSLDIYILLEVLKSGTLDMNYFGRILEFALVTLRKLSAPSIEDELKANHQKFLKELGEITQGGENNNALFTSLVIKGLQFVLRQIKGPASFEYLRSSFSNRYGPLTEAPISLPLVKQWLSSVMLVADQDWDDQPNSLSSLRLSNGAHSLEKAPITLRARGSVRVHYCWTNNLDSWQSNAHLQDMLL